MNSGGGRIRGSAPRRIRARGAGGSPRSSKMQGRRRYLSSRWDAAQTTNENRRHWANADSLSPDAAAIPAVRRTLRDRARYEVTNNSYARGIVDTFVTYILGRGPRLQIIHDSRDTASQIEDRFHEWMMDIDLSEKLNVLRGSQCVSGESFGLIFNNPGLMGEVKLDLRPIEADQVATPWSELLAREGDVDGIHFDDFGNVTEYVLLDRHPGDTGIGTLIPGSSTLIPSKFMLHLFKAERPGQSRGIPEITSALPLFALLRRYTLAVLGSAESVAWLGGVIHTNGPPGYDQDNIGDEDRGLKPLDHVEMERGTWPVLPDGYDISQIRAEQPATTYMEFIRMIIREIARCLNMPYNIAAGDSSDYNYASGRLDHQSFFRSIQKHRRRIELTALDRLFSMWLAEATRLTGYLPQAARSTSFRFSKQWFWDGFEHADPLKESLAAAARLASGESTLADLAARQGKDWERQLEQRAKEIRFMIENGIPVPSLGLGPELVELGGEDG